MLAGRRVLWDGAETVAAYAEEMSEFLAPSESTETRAFVRFRPSEHASCFGKGNQSRHWGHCPTAASLCVRDGGRRKWPLRTLGDGGRVRRQPRRAGAT